LFLTPVNLYLKMSIIGAIGAKVTVRHNVATVTIRTQDIRD